MYFKFVDDHFIYVILCVEDMLLTKKNMEIIKYVNIQLPSKFHMKDLGATNFILGMEIKRDQANKKLWANQRIYVETILQKSNM